MAAFCGPRAIGPARPEVGLPVDHQLKISKGVVVVAVRLLAEDAAQIRGQRDLPGGGLRVGAVLLGRGPHDLLLPLGGLIRVGLGIGAVAGEIRDREHGADEHLLVILAGIGLLLVVGEHRPGILGRALLLEMVEPIPDLLEEILGFHRSPVGQSHERLVEHEHFRIPRMLREVGRDQALRLVEIAAMERGPHRLEARDMRGAAGKRSDQAGDEEKIEAWASHGSTGRPNVRTDSSPATGSGGCDGSP